MDDTTLARVLAECTEEALEQMFFVQPLDDPAPVDSSSGPPLIAEVNFKGDPSGHLTLSISAQAARSIAADFLAEDEPVLSEQQVGEVLCELANIICGSVLTRVESSTLFRLDRPRLISECERFSERDAAVRSLNLWNGNLTVAIGTDSYAAK
jgi:CheY-specific phosphatase CheX